MKKNFLITITFATILSFLSTTAFASKSGKMSEAEVAHALEQTNMNCSLSIRKRGHKIVPAKYRGSGALTQKIEDEYCSTCAEYKSKLKKHYAAVNSQATLEEEEAQLRIQLLQAQLNALQSSSNSTTTTSSSTNTTNSRQAKK
jgi:hypothetical protein